MSVAQYYVYILSNHARTSFYVGVTNNLEERVLQHRGNEGGKFTATYKCHYLMYFEIYTDVKAAIGREKNLKNWHREWKVGLIKRENPQLTDLAEGWYE
jgi:putative endonuclease